MPKFLWWLFPLLLLTYTPVECGIFIPEELPSFLSLLYSIVPPLRIGKDSRFGAGFRVGPNADIQFLVELGPQTNTLPLGPGPSPDVDDTLPGVRRHVISSTPNTPLSSSLPKRRPSSYRNWGYNYIQPKRQKISDQTSNQNKLNSSNKNSIQKNSNYNIINTTLNNVSTTRFPTTNQESQPNNLNYINFEASTRKIVRLPDSIIIPVYNNTRSVAPVDIKRYNNEINLSSTPATVVNSNSVESNDKNKIVTKENTIATLVNNNSLSNKSAEVNTNKILEDSLKNSTRTSKKNDKKRNETRRPRVIRDWFLSLWDNLRKQGNSGGTT